MKCNKTILLIAGLCILLGVLLSAVAIFQGAAAPEHRELQTQTVDSGSISKINISANADDIHLRCTDADKITVSYATGKTKQYRFHVDGDALSLEAVSTRQLGLKWYDYLNFSFQEDLNWITVEIPSELQAEFAINTNYGDVSVSDLKGSMTIDADCGDVKLNRCTFSKLVCSLDFGDIDIDGISAETIQLTNHCGDIEAEGIAGNISASCDFGDISLGRVLGNDISLENNCGDIDCVILGNEADYTITAETNVGDKNIQNKSGGRYKLYAQTDFGDISIKFE